MANLGSYNVIGLMSGTSLDGLDLCFCTIWNEDEKWHYKILAAETVPYNKKWKQKLIQGGQLGSTYLYELHNELGTFYGQLAREFISKYKWKVDFVSSHGHTIFHQPDQGFTCQIGSGYHLMLQTKLPVICDFRSLDVALGGQGAPLVPIGDRLFFKKYKFCLNLGGISNISFDTTKGRKAFDICPVNMLLNPVSNRMGFEFDRDGALARKGKVIPPLLENLDKLDFYYQNPPKSLSLEWFKAVVWPLIESCSASYEDILCTSTHHIAKQIANEIIKYNGKGKNNQILATGGGAKNVFLIELLKNYLEDKVKVIVPDEQLIDYKEALIFALMGVLRWQKKTNCLSSVTGALRDCSGGIIYEPI